MLTSIAVSKALALLLQASAVQAETPTEGATIGRVGQCDPQDGPGLTWTAEARQETRDRVQATCRAVGASKAVCEWLDVSVVRESSGRPGVRHTRALGEVGLGPLGLSLRWHHDKWPGADEDPAFCTPEASALVALEIAHLGRHRSGLTGGSLMLFTRTLRGTPAEVALWLLWAFDVAGPTGTWQPSSTEASDPLPARGEGLSGSMAATLAGPTLAQRPDEDGGSEG